MQILNGPQPGANSMIIVIIICAMISCKNSSTATKESDEESYEVNIKHRPGDDYFNIVNEDTISFISYPFYIGEFRNIKSTGLYCIVISKDLKRRRRIKVKVKGILRMRELEKEVDFAIGVPFENEMNSIFVDDFSDFVTKYSPVKNIIQSWLLNRCGLGCSELISWQNEQYADLFLQKRK